MLAFQLSVINSKWSCLWIYFCSIMWFLQMYKAGHLCNVLEINTFNNVVNKITYLHDMHKQICSAAATQPHVGYTYTWFITSGIALLFRTKGNLPVFCYVLNTLSHVSLRNSHRYFIFSNFQIRKRYLLWDAVQGHMTKQKSWLSTQSFWLQIDFSVSGPVLMLFRDVITFRFCDNPTWVSNTGFNKCCVYYFEQITWTP